MMQVTYSDEVILANSGQCARCEYLLEQFDCEEEEKSIIYNEIMNN